MREDICKDLTRDHVPDDSVAVSKESRRGLSQPLALSFWEVSDSLRRYDWTTAVERIA